MKFTALTVSSAVFTLIIYCKFFPSVLQLCDLETCPYCFGTGICDDIVKNRITLRYEFISDFLYNIISVKNVYFAHYGNIPVVLKKITYDSALINTKDEEDHFDELIRFLVNDTSSVKNFKICDKSAADLFLRTLSHINKETLEMLIRINVEPALLEIFKNYADWPVPKLYGSCGRLIVVENAGWPLNDIRHYNWFDRAYVAYQILGAMKNFTINHGIFRLYLTDISPDNIVVDKDFKATFIDLENAILQKKIDEGEIHYSEYFADDSFIYSEGQICGSSISDHNIYSTCKLLLSKYAPWPMMENGLLHSPPKVIEKHFNILSTYIEQCVYSTIEISRFSLSDNILDILRYILQNNTKYII